MKASISGNQCMCSMTGPMTLPIWTPVSSEHGGTETDPAVHHLSALWLGWDWFCILAQYNDPQGQKLCNVGMPGRNGPVCTEKKEHVSINIFTPGENTPIKHFLFNMYCKPMNSTLFASELNKTIQRTSVIARQRAELLHCEENSGGGAVFYSCFSLQLHSYLPPAHKIMVIIILTERGRETQS